MNESAGTPGRWHKFATAYSALAFITFNTLLAIVAVNLLLYLVLWARDAVMALEAGRAEREIARSMEGGQVFRADGAPLPGPKRSAYQIEWFDYSAYGGDFGETEVAGVLDEFLDLGARGFVYQPWVQFAEPAVQGKHLNVETDARGFPHRRTSRPSATRDGVPTLQIFAIGGSTTFGYNVPDAQTWPSALARLLEGATKTMASPVPLEVRNYGRAYYNPSQEVVLFMDLLRSGQRPDMAIFVDGVNLGPAQDVPQFTAQAARGFSGLQFGGSSTLLDRLGWIPMVRVAARLSESATPAIVPAKAGESRDPVQLAERFRSSWAIARELCRLYDVSCLFVLQPDPVLNYEMRLYRRPVSAGFVAERAERRSFYESLGSPEGVIDLRGLFQAWGPNRKAIIDDVHYSPGFNDFLAEHIASRIDLSSLSAQKGVRVPSVPTGARRTTTGLIDPARDP